MSPPPSELHLGALQCHFTWDLSSSRLMLLQLQDKLLDICPEEGNPWRGHISNLLGFIQTRLGHSDKALRLFSSASEALRGPALLVNYSDLAWLHHKRGEAALSQEYLQRVEELQREHLMQSDHPTQREHPTDPAEERVHPEVLAEERVHPEVLAEKAWVLMKLGRQQKRVAAELLERALEEQPERAEWRSSQVIALMNAHKHHPDGVDPEVLLKVRRAHEEDPENMYLSAEYLSQRAKRGKQVRDEMDELVAQIVERGRGSYSGLKSALRYYRLMDAVDVAIFWAEEALEKHPDSRYVKRCAALCYKWRVLFHKDGASQRHLVDRGVSLLKEVISLYPDTALVKEIDLADLYGKSEPAKGEDMFCELLQRHLEPPDTQLLYHRYAKHLLIHLHDRRRAIRYHQRAACIDHDSFFRENSIEALQRLTKSSPDSVRAEILRSSLSVRLEELQCHFTWELERSQTLLVCVRDRLEDLLPDHSHPWRAHIHNLLGFIQTRLGRSDHALSLFMSASEALRGPALLVNYSDLAWLHHKRGEAALSQEYLQRVEELQREYLTERDHPTQRDHPEVLAEKAFSLTHFNNDRKRLGAELWAMALGAEPGRVAWRSAQALALLDAQRHSDVVDEELFTQIRRAADQDPENLQLKAELLAQCARRGQEVGPEAAALAAQVLLRPDRLHRDIRSVLELYRAALSVEAAVELAVKALDRRPDSRCLKACLAMCYKWRIQQGEAASQELIENTAALLREVIALYPDSSFRTEIDLANTYAKSNHSLADASRIYDHLLRRDLDPANRQMLFNYYAKFLKHDKHDYMKSTEYHLRAAEIPLRSYFRANSIDILQSVRPRNRRLRREVDQFLSSLQDDHHCPRHY